MILLLVTAAGIIGLGVLLYMCEEGYFPFYIDNITAKVGALLLVGSVAYMIFAMVTGFPGSGSSSGECYTDWDGRSNSWVCD